MYLSRLWKGTDLESNIDQISGELGPHYEPFGWHHWPEYPWMSYQFRRGLGETQEGGGAVGECLQTASRIDPADEESWYVEWLQVAERNRTAGDEAESMGNVVTAKHFWLRAVNYYRQAEFWLPTDDPRRLVVFGLCESCFVKAGRYFIPPLEVVRIPYDVGTFLHGYYLRAPYRTPRQPVLVAFGGLDSFKEELLFMVANGMLDRGISCLLVDGPGQGATIRREGITTRFDYEVPVGRCIDYLEARDDVDPERFAVSGTSLGGYYAARAAAFEHRLAAAISHGAIWDLGALWKKVDEDFGLARHIKWVFGASSIEEARAAFSRFTLDGILGNMRCPYLIIHGAHDVLVRRQARLAYESARQFGVDVELRYFEEEETGAEHCQHDNPTIGMDYMADWLAVRFGIDQSALHDQKV